MRRLVLKASAGTGKTYRLSLEYIVALCKGTDYKNILVMTFTRKATAEIKKEVLEKIKSFVEIYNLIKEKKENNKSENIRKELENIEIEAEKKEKYLSLLDSIEKISDLKIDREILEKLDIVYKDILKNKEKIKIYTIDSFLNLIFKNITMNFLKIKTYSMLDEEDNNYYYKKVLEKIFTDKDLFSEFKKFFLENSEKDIDVYIKAIQNLIAGRWKYLISIYTKQDFFKKEKLNITKKPEIILKEIFEYIEKDCGKNLEDSLKSGYKIYLNKNEEKIRDLLIDDYKNILGFTPFNGNKFKKKTDVEYKEDIMEMYESLQDNLSFRLYNEVLLSYEEDIVKLSKEIYKIYDDLKIRDKKFTFNDIAIYTYERLFNSENLLIDENGLTSSFFENLDMTVDTVFIDEFQDTSVLQWKILYEIIKKAKNVVCVGDEKQSIYGWRDGEKRLFENLNNILEAELENMKTSYRSDINIVEYTNKIFKEISENNLNWKFENSEANSKEKGYVKCVYVEKDKEEENLAIQTLIEELKNSNLKNYSDIAIIARKNKDLTEIAKLLENEKIPYILNKESKLTELKAIGEYLELLKYLIYGSELSLFNFLASDLSEFGTDEIEFLLKNKSDLFHFLNNNIEENFQNKLSKKVLEFLEKIKKLKEEYKKLNSQELTYRIFDDFKFSVFFNKKEELKNIAEAYLISKKYNSILELLKAYQNSEISFSQNTLSNNAIELMTIHKSKGLQFKTVFVLNKNDKRKNVEKDFIFFMDEDYKKVKFSLFLKKGYEEVLKKCFPNEVAAYRTMEEEEEINNLYVAITRAKNNLFIISENESLSKYELGEINKFENLEKEEDKTEIIDKEIFYLLKNSLENRNSKTESEINFSKFSLETEEKRMLGILIHFFLENIKLGSQEEINYSIKLCYKNYLSYFGEKKLKNIFSEKNIKHIFEIAGNIFSNHWDYIYSEYELYDYENKQSYRIDRIMIKNSNQINRGKIYIVDYKTGSKNENQLKNYVEILKKNFGEEIKNYDISTKFLEFNIEY